MARTRTYCTTIEIDVVVTYSAAGRYIPARVHCSNDDAHPAEYPEIELESVCVDGDKTRTDILGLLGRDLAEEILGSVDEDAASSEQDEAAAAAEDRADAIRDERRFG